MEICLISLVEDVGCTSLRYLSSYIRARGHKVNMIFLPRQYSEGWGGNQSYRYPYSQMVFDRIAEICSSSDIVGLSLMSCHFDNAIRITRFLKKILDKPVIWGGVHPTIRPLECLEYADVVCVGEGEISTAELLDQLSHGANIDEISVQGLVTNTNRDVVSSAQVTNLDDLGFPDYDMDNQFVLYKGDIIKLANQIVVEYMNYSYRTSMSRGCAHACTYCCNNIFRKLNTGSGPIIRWRSLEAQIEELKRAKVMINGLSQIDFADDTFMARPYENLRDFALRYKEEIGLMFRVLTSPTTVTYEKIKVLADAGLNSVGIGVQSASEPIRKMYNRKENLAQVRNASEIINRVSAETQRKIIVRYDFIVDNPWGGEEDVEKSIRFALQLQKPFELAVFSLVFYPGTELYNKAKAEGMIKDDLNEVYRITQLTPKYMYMNEVFLLMGQGAPKWLIRLLLKTKMRSRAFARVLRKVFVLLVYYPRALRFFLFERFRHNKGQVFSRAFQKIVNDCKAGRMARRMPQFDGVAGEILAENSG